MSESVLIYWSTAVHTDTRESILLLFVGMSKYGHIAIHHQRSVQKISSDTSDNAIPLFVNIS